MNITDKPLRSQFNLGVIKSKDRASVTIKAIATLTEGEMSYDIPYDTTYPCVPHPDMINALEGLQQYLARDYGYTLFSDFINRDAFKATKEQKKFAERFLEELMFDIKVNGVSFVDEGLVKIMGTYDGRAINSVNLSYENPQYGEDLKKICETIQEEAYAYMFEAKRAQLDIAFNEEMTPAGE